MILNALENICYLRNEKNAMFSKLDFATFWRESSPQRAFSSNLISPDRLKQHGAPTPFADLAPDKARHPEKLN